jgi:hypothetical protein
LGERAAYGAVAREQTSCQKSGARRSHVRLPLRGGKRMTAEITILNKTGVALAADSKVTIGGGRKTFDTANKIFSLSKFHPVGIMIFGNAEFMQYPWQTIVKMYRDQKRDRGEDSISLWAQYFITYVTTFGEFTAEDKVDNFRDIVMSWFSHINQLALSELSEGEEPATPETYNKAILRQLDRQLRVLEKAKTLYANDYVKELKKRYSTDVKRMVILRFETDAIRKIATSFVWKAISRAVFSPNSSGIVVTGYGCKEVFPGLAHYETYGYIGDRIKLVLKFERSITKNNRSMVIPFAQKEMVYRFMDGIDPGYHRFITVMFSKAMADACRSVLDTYGKDEYKTDTVIRKLVRGTVESMKKTVDEAKKFQNKKFSRPIINMIAMLSKDELPNVAESLVALTSLKRHVSEDAETVGGPIDVALISKGDGFIWLKRKHYFKSELNRMFLRNYFQYITREGATNGATTDDGRDQSGANRP